jgi:hypothetical protein
MKGIDSSGAPIVHVPGWMGGWMNGWVDGSKGRFKDCLQQSKTSLICVRNVKFTDTLLQCST